MLPFKVCTARMGYAQDAIGQRVSLDRLSRSVPLAFKDDEPAHLPNAFFVVLAPH